MGGVKLEKNNAKFPIHEPFELESQFLNRNIKDNVLITYMKIYENCTTTLVAMATVHEKFQMTFPIKVLSQFL